MEPADEELIEAVRKGDPDSFEPLVQKYSPRLFAMARRYARRQDEVEDVVQEIWLKAYQRLGTFRGDAPFEHWLMRLAGPAPNRCRLKAMILKSPMVMS